MNTNLISFSNYAISFVKQSVLPTITAHQKKILAIASVAFLCLAACYALGRLYLTYKSKDNLKDLFGEMSLNSIPFLEANKISASDFPSIDPKNMSSSIMQGQDSKNRKFFAFRLQIKIHPDVYNELILPDSIPKDENRYFLDDRVFILFQRHTDFPEVWYPSFPGLAIPVYPFFKSPLNDKKGPQTKENKEAFKRLQMLIKDKCVEYDKCFFELY